MWSEGRLIGRGFCCLLQVEVPGEQESSHVAREDQRVSYFPEDPQRGLEVNVSIMSVPDDCGTKAW